MLYFTTDTGPPSSQVRYNGAMSQLPAAFFQRDTVQVARDLLGKTLVCGPCAGQIVETEAYHQHGDAACHAYRGPTRRNASMFRPGGTVYIYRIHQVFCLNLVTESEGVGSAVLIRAIVPTTSIELMRDRRQWTGPLP